MVGDIDPGAAGPGSRDSRFDPIDPGGIYADKGRSRYNGTSETAEVIMYIY
jgi:hypothetical protein